jgi:hypothetical protein
MPAVIKSKRATLSEDAISWALDFWGKSYRKIKSTIHNAPVSQQADLDFKYGPALDRLYGIAKDPAVRDYHLTLLRATPYVRFERQSIQIPRAGGTVDYLVGTTKTVVIDERGPWDMGRYLVYVPMQVLTDGPNTSLMHFIPEREPTTAYRHPHHRLNLRTSTTETPLLENPSTCWGDFGQIVIRIVNEGDLVDLLRTIAIYLGRYNEGSPLTSIENCPHRRAISKDQAKEIRKNGD